MKRIQLSVMMAVASCGLFTTAARAADPSLYVQYLTTEIQEGDQMEVETIVNNPLGFSFQLYNFGDADLVFDSYELQGPAAVDYVAAFNLGTTVPPGGSCPKPSCHG